MAPGSRTPTFAAIRLAVSNDRWAGVPFVVKAGKALDDRAVVVRMQVRATHPYQGSDC